MSELITTAGTHGKAGWKTVADGVGKRLARLEAKSLCVDARRRTKLEDFGDPPLEPALSVLTESLEREADLHPLGRFLMRVHLRDLLETRLRLTDAWRKQREPLDTSVMERPVIITGMPRSGSTFLHELLTEDPGNRAPRVWEVMFPVSNPGKAGNDRDRRGRKTAGNPWWFRRPAPPAESGDSIPAGTPHSSVAVSPLHVLFSDTIQ